MAAITARNHFACVRWGTGHAACRVMPDLEFGVWVIPLITTWAAGLALLLIPGWTALRDRQRRPPAPT